MSPRNLEELRAIKDPAARALAAKAYIEQREEAIREARKIRDAAIVKYAETHSVPTTARDCGVSQATVKVVKR